MAQSSWQQPQTNILFMVALVRKNVFRVLVFYLDKNLTNYLVFFFW